VLSKTSASLSSKSVSPKSSASLSNSVSSNNARSSNVSNSVSISTVSQGGHINPSIGSIKIGAKSSTVQQSATSNRSSVAVQTKQVAGGHVNPSAGNVKIDIKNSTAQQRATSNRSSVAVQTKQVVGGHVNPSTGGIKINLNLPQKNTNGKSNLGGQVTQPAKIADKTRGTVNPTVSSKTKINIGSQVSSVVKNISGASKQLADKYTKSMDSENAGYMAKSVDQIIRGNYTKNVTGLGTVGQVAAGVTGVDLPMDIRDITYDLKNWDGSKGHAVKTALDVASVLPVVGGVLKNADEISALAKSGEKILKGSTDAAKVADQAKILDKASNVAKDTSIAIKGGGDDFIGILKGEKVTLPNVKGQTIQYTKVSTEKLAELRKAFNTTDRKEFLSYLSSDREMLQQLKTAGLTDTDILKMKNGYVPTGYQVHHKIPLDGGGTNSLDNLVLIKNDPYHKVITNTQNSVTSGVKSGQTIKIDNWPTPEGKIYPKNK